MATACVTGATGYVASELIRQLLSRGFAVKATVRCATESSRLQYLRDLADKSEGALQLVQVPDIENASDALDHAVQGVSYVFHVASPFRFDGDPKLDIVQPAVEGTRTVLQAAAKHKASGLQRVVVTSSVCGKLTYVKPTPSGVNSVADAIHDMNRKQAPKQEQYCEEDWNNVSELSTEAYWVSKVEAEKVAWQLAEDLGLDVVTILPNFVLGPIISAEQSGGVSVGFMKGILESPLDKAFDGSWTVVDVRDVAAAHILAATHPQARGRYIISQPTSISAKFITDTLKSTWPAAVLPDGQGAEASHINSSRVVKDLGLQYTPVADTVKDMAAALLKTGIATPTWYKAGST